MVGSGEGDTAAHHLPQADPQRGLQLQHQTTQQVHHKAFLSVLGIRDILSDRMQSAKYLYEEREGSGSGSVPLTNGSGSGRPKNMRIRIPNTGYVNKIRYFFNMVELAFSFVD